MIEVLRKLKIPTLTVVVAGLRYEMTDDNCKVIWVQHLRLCNKQDSYLGLFTKFCCCSYYLAPPSIYKSVAQIALSEEDKMSIASKIAGNAIKRAPSGPVSTYGTKNCSFFSSSLIMS